LKGKLFGLWGCSLGYDLRMVYKINDETKEIIVFSVGTHKWFIDEF
jgi:mRNA-degrading endonuclease YafQ of YafQ-DinJ toxin-antitoxin module